MEQVIAIDYEHASLGAHCTGIVSGEDGRAEAIWQLDREGAPVSCVQPVAWATLDALWRGIAASLDGRGVFWRNLVEDPTRPLDPEAEHLIVAVVAQGGRHRRLTFAVPADEAAPEFTAWLAKLGVPEPSVPALAA